MIIRNITDQIKVTRALVGTTTATSQQDGVTFDMAADGGYDGIIFFGNGITTANAGNFVRVEQGNQSNMSDAATIAGSRATAVANGDYLQINLPKVQERYVRINVIRAGATTATTDMYAVQYRAGGPLPIVQTGTNRIITQVAPGYVEGTP
jgi:autotransporter adhesin